MPTVKLVEITSRVVGQAKQSSHEIAEGVKQANLSVMHKATTQLDEMIPRVQRVPRQARPAGVARQYPGRGKVAQHI